MKKVISLNKKGNDSFRLADIAEVGNFNHGVSHTSLVDCLNTIEVAKKIKHGTPEIWDASLQTAHRSDAEKVIDSEKDKAMNDVKNTLAELCIDIAEKIIKKDLSKDSSQKKYVEDLIKEINKTK